MAMIFLMMSMIVMMLTLKNHDDDDEKDNDECMAMVNHGWYEMVMLDFLGVMTHYVKDNISNCIGKYSDDEDMMTR